MTKIVGGLVQEKMGFKVDLTVNTSKLVLESWVRGLFITSSYYMCLDMCLNRCLNRCLDICLDMCLDMCLDICMAMHLDCVWTFV